MTAGVTLDGWAHSHNPNLETFFTPWHAVLYSGYLAAAIFLLASLMYSHRHGASWRQSLPVGYGLSLLGAGIFAVGGVLDLLWHTLFGIERSIEALLSPTHLILALGAILIVGGPFRSALYRSGGLAKNKSRLFPMLFSLAYMLTQLAFFTQFANPVSSPLATRSALDLTTPLGIASILLQSALFMGAALLAVRHWSLPFGAFALLYTVPALVNVIVARASLPIVLAGSFAVLTGLLVDLLYLALKPTTERKVELRLFAFLAPVIIYGAYFLGLGLTAGIGWSVHLWTGSVVMAGIIGLLLSYILVLPAASSEQPTV